MYVSKIRLSNIMCLKEEIWSCVIRLRSQSGTYSSHSQHVAVVIAADDYSDDIRKSGDADDNKD